MRNKIINVDSIKANKDKLFITVFINLFIKIEYTFEHVPVLYQSEWQINLNQHDTLILNGDKEIK